MKVLASLGLAAACLLASPALAGPAGTGLTFTEEVAKKNQQKRAANLQAAADCDKASPADVASKKTSEHCRAS